METKSPGIVVRSLETTDSGVENIDSGISQQNHIVFYITKQNITFIKSFQAAL